MNPEYWYEGLRPGDLNAISPEFWFEGLSGGDIVAAAPVTSSGRIQVIFI